MTAARFDIRLERRELLVNGVPVRLGARAFDVLAALARQRGQFLSKSALLDMAWPGLVVEENNLEVQVSTLRRLLGRDAILTVAGRGYCLVPAADPPQPATPQALPPLHNLPQALSSFIGRTADIIQLLGLSSQTRLLTLTGSGGCGKTRLSIEVARALLPRFADGVWLVELAALADPALVPQTVAAALGLREAPGKAAQQLLTEHLAGRSALLVLDNAEHLLDACAQMAGSVLSSCAGVTLLVSSRAALGITGELIYRVPSLGLPEAQVAGTPEQLLRADAVRLFVERVQLHRTNFLLDADNAAAVANICRRLDGIPLAIELAAARLRSLSLKEVDQRLDQSFQLLVGGSRTALPRHQTLRALIDWSHALLNAAERRLFARVSVFRHGFSLAAAEAVCCGEGIATDDVLPLLTSLVDQSLLSPEDCAGVTRLRMLETVSQYARDCLLDTPDSDTWRRRHAAHFLGVLQAAEAGLRGAQQAAWLNLLEAEHDNLRAALQWSLSTRDTQDTGLRMCAVLWRFWSNRGHGTEGLQWVQRLLQARGDAAAPALRAKALHGAAVMAFRLCDYTESDAFNQHALQIRRALDEREGVADSLNSLCSSAMIRGRLDEAEAYASECIALRRQIGDARAMAESLNNIAGIAAIRGDLAAAAPLYEESVRLHRDVANQHGVALGLVNLGVIASKLGDFAAAAQRLQEALAIHRALGDAPSVAMDLVLLGHGACASGDLPGSRHWYRECLACARERADPLCQFELLQGVAWLGQQSGQAHAAARLYGAAERGREEIGAPIEPGERPAHESRVLAVRAALGDDAAFARAWQQGRWMGLGAALVEVGLLCCPQPSCSQGVNGEPSLP